jgi:hypothetical protein
MWDKTLPPPFLARALNYLSNLKSYQKYHEVSDMEKGSGQGEASMRGGRKESFESKI